MFLTLALMTLVLAPDPVVTYVGREHQLHVSVPRIEGTATIDGALNDSVWQQAALLTGFSQFSR